MVLDGILKGSSWCYFYTFILHFALTSSLSRSHGGGLAGGVGGILINLCPCVL